MNTAKKLLVSAIFLISAIVSGWATTPLNLETPVFGGQVIIEPGQSDEYIETLFKRLSENNMNVCRIRMFESYMTNDDGTRDYSLFDKAFKYAEKYNVKIIGTFFPKTDKTDIGGWKFPYDTAQLNSFAKFIKDASLHFKLYKSLAAWVLINEPGGSLRNCPFIDEKYAEFFKQNPEPYKLPNGRLQLVSFSREKFARHATSQMLQWIANEVRKYDKSVHLHVNTHAIFFNATEYDFPFWRSFLSSFGGSAHPGFHYVDFSQQDYTFAIAANSEIIDSGAANAPWFMTEIQGGNNTYSAQKPYCPTKEDIAKWLWSVLGANGKGAIFWSLNPRASGFEAGEWALLDFQNNPSDRMFMAAKVAKCVNENPQIFKSLKKAKQNTTLVYVKESLWAENRQAQSYGKKFIWQSINGYFKALAQGGNVPAISAFEEFDFSKSNYTNQTIILTHQIALSAEQVKKLENFVGKGGNLFVDGLTGFYDHNSVCTMMTGFLLRNLLGGQISEFKKLNKRDYNIDYNFFEDDGENPITLRGNAWRGIIKPDSAKVVCKKNGEVYATKNKFGNGTALWVPTMPRKVYFKYEEGIFNLLKRTFDMPENKITFKNYEQNAMLRLMECNTGYLAIVINNQTSQSQFVKKTRTSLLGGIFGGENGKNVLQRKIELKTELKNPKILFSTSGGDSIDGNTLAISDNSVCVLFYPKN